MPAWVASDETWERAKEAARKTYKEDEDAFWPAVTEIYKNMGGKIKSSYLLVMADKIMQRKQEVENILQAVHVKQHQRTSKSGKVSTVREHEDKRKALLSDYELAKGPAQKAAAAHTIAKHYADTTGSSDLHGHWSTVASEHESKVHPVHMEWEAHRRKIAAPTGGPYDDIGVGHRYSEKAAKLSEAAKDKASHEKARQAHLTAAHHWGDLADTGMVKGAKHMVNASKWHMEMAEHHAHQSKPFEQRYREGVKKHGEIPWNEEHEEVVGQLVEGALSEDAKPVSRAEVDEATTETSWEESLDHASKVLGHRWESSTHTDAAQADEQMKAAEKLMEPIRKRIREEANAAIAEYKETDTGEDILSHQPSSALDQVRAAHIKQYQRTSRSGKVSTVREHEDVRHPIEKQWEQHKGRLPRPGKESWDDFKKGHKLSEVAVARTKAAKDEASHAEARLAHTAAGHHWDAVSDAGYTGAESKVAGQAAKWHYDQAGEHAKMERSLMQSWEKRHAAGIAKHGGLKWNKYHQETAERLATDQDFEERPNIPLSRAADALYEEHFEQAAEHANKILGFKEGPQTDQESEDQMKTMDALLKPLERRMHQEANKIAMEWHKAVSQASSPAAEGDLVLASDPTANAIQCRAAVGSQIRTSKPWVPGEPVEFVYAPEGQHTITAGFRRSDTITITVQVDERTPGDLQEAFEHLTATMPKQEPYGDEDHESKKATVRFPIAGTTFKWGEVKGERGVIIAGGEPTTYGADAVNGKVYRSWSPEFTTDADFAKASRNTDGHWTFPDGVRGSERNPARLVGVNFVVGALTNRPAFRAMPPVKAKQAETSDTIQAAGTSEGAIVKAAEAQCPCCELAAMVTNVQLAHWAANTQTNEHEALGQLYSDLAALVDTFVETYAGKTGELPSGVAVVQVETDLGALIDQSLETVEQVKAEFSVGDDDDLLNILADIEAAWNKTRYLLKATDKSEGKGVVQAASGAFAAGHPFYGNRYMKGASNAAALSKKAMEASSELPDKAGIVRHKMAEAYHRLAHQEHRKSAKHASKLGLKGNVEKHEKWAKMHLEHAQSHSKGKHWMFASDTSAELEDMVKATWSDAARAAALAERRAHAIGKSKAALSMTRRYFMSGKLQPEHELRAAIETHGEAAKTHEEVAQFHEASGDEPGAKEHREVAEFHRKAEKAHKGKGSMSYNINDPKDRPRMLLQGSDGGGLETGEDVLGRLEARAKEAREILAAQPPPPVTSERILSQLVQSGRPPITNQGT